MASFVWTEVSSAWNAGKGVSSLLISSWENLNPMQDLEPPMKVILYHSKVKSTATSKTLFLTYT